MIESQIESKNFIGGEWVPADSGEVYEITNPANPSETLGTTPKSGEAETRRAIGAAEEALQRSITAAEAVGDAVRATRALIYRAMCESDRCDYAASEATFESALGRIPASETALLAYGLTGLARVYVRTNRLDEGGKSARVAVEAARKAGAVAIVPWALVWSAEAALLSGDVTTAERLYGEAFALGCESGDPCWETLALRGLALVALQHGRGGEAKELLCDAVARCRRLPDVYKWVEAVVLTDVVELDGAVRDIELPRALELAIDGPMPDLYTKLRDLSDLQTGSQTTRPYNP